MNPPSTTIGRGRPARLLAAVVALAAVAALLAPPSAALAQGRGERAGDVSVVAASGGGRVSEGGSGTEFTLQLPEGAACQGDSANDGYRIQSFLVPASDDPGSIVYRSIGPSGDGRIALYRTDTDQFVQALTQANPGPGQPGVIPPSPPLTFGVYRPVDLQPGPHRMGIACSLLNETTRYWDVEVELTRDESDQPAEIHWAVAGASSSGASSSSPTPFVVIAVILLAAAGGAVYLLARRPHSRRPTPTEEPR